MGKSNLADIPGNFFVQRVGSLAAVASDGAAARWAEGVFVAPANLKLLSIWRVATANEATHADVTASYREISIWNGGTSGTVTTVPLGTCNTSASKAAWGSRGFTLAATPTVTQGAQVFFSHSTVGGDHNDGTILIDAQIQIAYELL